MVWKYYSPYVPGIERLCSKPQYLGKVTSEKYVVVSRLCFHAHSSGGTGMLPLCNALRGTAEHNREPSNFPFPHIHHHHWKGAFSQPDAVCKVNRL